MTKADRKAFLKFLRATAKEVAAWPSWMREGVHPRDLVLVRKAGAK
jgi:hypothetical protein